MSVKIGSNLRMDGSIFEKDVNLNYAAIKSTVFLDAGATFKNKLVLVSAQIGSDLFMDGSTFQGDVILIGVRVNGNFSLRDKSTFKSELNLASANIGSNLDINKSTFEGLVYLTECKVNGAFLFGFSEVESARRINKASLILLNTHVGTLQDWWQSENANAWPKVYQLEGFTYNRLGTFVEDKKSTCWTDR